MLQFVPQKCVPIPGGGKLLEGGLWGRRRPRFGAAHLELRRGVRHGVRPVVKLPVQLPGLQVLEERQQLTRNLHVADVREQVHVSETVDGDEGQVALALAQVVERVSETHPVRGEEVHRLC